MYRQLLYRYFERDITMLYKIIKNNIMNLEKCLFVLLSIRMISPIIQTLKKGLVRCLRIKIFIVRPLQSLKQIQKKNIRSPWKLYFIICLQIQIKESMYSLSSQGQRGEIKFFSTISYRNPFLPCLGKSVHSVCWKKIHTSRKISAPFIKYNIYN